MNKLTWCSSPVNQNTENTNEYLTMETYSILTDILGSMDNDNYMLLLYSINYKKVIKT